MPELFRIGSFVFSFYSKEHEPIHVHIKYEGSQCKIEIDSLKVTQVRGFKKHELNYLVKTVEKFREEIKERWYEYFKEKKD